MFPRSRVRLRVGFDGRALVSPAGGVKRYTREMFAAIAAADPSLEVVALAAPEEIDLPAGVRRGPAATSLPTNLGWALSGLPLSARRAGLDLLHAPAYTAPTWGRCPVVLTVHDVSYARRPEWYPYRSDALRRWFYRRSARVAARILTDSQFSKAEIVAAYRIPADRIDVVPLAAGPTFEPASDRTAAAAGAGIGCRFVLHVGDLHVRRNVTVALDAVLRLRARRPDTDDVQLVLAGVDRGVGRALEARARAAGHADALRALGVVDEARLRALYQSAAALVHPSRYEGFGLPLVEAMACGAPVIAARAAASPEVLGPAGILVDPDDVEGFASAIEGVVTDPARRALLRIASLERAAHFTWRAAAEATIETYRRVWRS